IRECAVVIVVVQIVGHGVVGDQEIGPAIVIVIGPHHAQAIVTNVIVDAGLDRNLFKGAVTTIVVEKVGFAFEAPGTALYENAFEPAEFVAAELRKIIHVQVGIAGHEQVHVAVAIVISPGCAGAETSTANSGLLGDVL